MTTTSYSVICSTGTRGPPTAYPCECPRSSFQGRQWHECRSGRRALRLGNGGRLFGIEAPDPRAELPMLVSQLPVGFGEALEPPGQPPRLEERRCGSDE